MSHSGSNPFGVLSDPMLPHLGTALDVTGMAARFAAGFPARGAASVSAVKSCAIERIYYRPGRHCGLLYRLALQNGSETAADEWVFARFVMRDRLHERFATALSVARESHGAQRALGGMDPVSLWTDLDMILWVFPHDHKLPALPRVVDSGFVRGCVVANLARFALPTGSEATPPATDCAGIRFDRIKYMPDKRCVLRYQADLVDTQGASRTVTFFGKTYPDARSADLFASQASAWEQLTAQGAALGVPRPLLHLEAEHTIWLEDWGGLPLIEAARERSWDELVTRAAAAVAALHCSRITGFPPAPTPDQVLQTALEDGPKYAGRVPAQRNLVVRILEHLRSTQPAPDAAGWPRVPIHGACRAEQMLIRGSETALIDLDSLAEGDPLLDVAEFVASLEFLALCGTSPGLDFARASECFLESYAARVPWHVDRGRVSWYALAFAVSKLHASIKHLEMVTLARLEREGEALVGRWLRGEAETSA
jgi:hypothetical protein